MSLERVVALVVGLALLGIALWSARRSRARGDGMVTTLGVFSLVWGCVLIAFAIPLVRYTTTPVGVWLVVYGSIVTFVVGCLWAERRYRNLERVPEENRQRPDARRLRFAWLFFAVLGLVGFAGFVNAVDSVIGWRAIFDNPGLTREIQTTSSAFSDNYGPWKFLTYFNQVAFVLWTLAIRERSFRGAWRIAWVLGPVSLVPFMFTGDRTLMIISLIWAGTFQLLYRPPKNPVRLLTLGAGAAVVLVLVFALLGGRVGKTVDNHPEIAETLTTRSVDPIALPYVYLTANIPAFGLLTEDPLRPHTHGKLTLLPATKLLHGLGAGGDPPEIVGAFYPIPFETFNNFSWLGVFYTDFGALGALLLPLLFAFITTAIVTRAARRGTLLSIWAGSLLLYCVAFSPMLPKFPDTLTWEFLLLGLVVAPVIRQDLGPARLTGLVRSFASQRPGLAVASGAALVTLGAISLVGLLSSQAGSPSTTTVDNLEQKLLTAAADAESARSDGDFPGSQALASRLHAHDPTTRFVALAQPTELPLDPDAIGVHSDGSWLVLRSFVSDQVVAFDNSSTTKNVRIMPLESRAETTGPDDGERDIPSFPIWPELIQNGDFQLGQEHWNENPGEVAQLSIEPGGRDGGQAVRVTGSGRAGTGLVLVQGLDTDARRGACFEFGVWVREDQLSRPLQTWVNFVDGNEDSSLRLFVDESMPGTSPGSGEWRRISDAGRLPGPATRVDVFAVDSGSKRMSGEVWIDDISLRRTC